MPQLCAVFIDDLRTGKKLQIADQVHDDKANQHHASDGDDGFFPNGRTVKRTAVAHDSVVYTFPDPLLATEDFRESEISTSSWRNAPQFPLLQRALGLGIELLIDDEPTRLLAIQSLLKTPDKIIDEHWRLAAATYDPEFYAVFTKKFPKSEDEYRGAADVLHLFALVVSQRMKEAADFAIEAAPRLRGSSRSITDAATHSLRKAGFDKQVIAFLRELLTRDPELPYWGTMIAISAHVHDSKGALEFMRTIMARPELTAPARATASTYFANALLAADELDEGIRVLRALVKSHADSKAVNQNREQMEQALMPSTADRLRLPARCGKGRRRQSRARPLVAHLTLQRRKPTSPPH